MTDWIRRHVLVTSLLVLFCSLSVRMFIALRQDPTELVDVYSDARSYLGPATTLLEHGTFVNNHGKPEIQRTPGYPLFLAVIMTAAGADLRRMLLIQTAILAVGPLILYVLARRILPPVPALVGSLIAAVSPWGAVLASAPLSDGLFLILLTLAFLAMNVAANSPAVTAGFSAAALGVITGVAVLVRPIWPLVILVPAAFLFYTWPKPKGTRLLVIVILICALAPVALWRERNRREAHFASISDIAGETAWHYLAARVRGELSGQDRFQLNTLAAQEEQNWGLPRWSQAVDDERWRQANAVFKAHPFLTAYAFTRSAGEHMIHPSPDVLGPARLNFRGDYLVLAVIWGTLMLSAVYGLVGLNTAADRYDIAIDGRLVVVMLAICLLITLSSGISFGAGSRLRAPLEAVVPLLAALGFTRLFGCACTASVADSRVE